MGELQKGPGTWESISPLSDYWPSVKVLDFGKDVLNVETSNKEPKTNWCSFLQMFSDVTFNPETVLTKITGTTCDKDS